MTGTDPEDSLVSFLQTSVGDHLRSVVRYAPADHEWTYLRDRSSQIAQEGVLEEMLDDCRSRRSWEDGHSEGLSPGAHQATIRLHDEMVLIHFPRGPDVGTLVTVDPAVGSEIAGFLTQCLDHLAGSGGREAAGSAGQSDRSGE